MAKKPQSKTQPATPKAQHPAMEMSTPKGEVISSDDRKRLEKKLQRANIALLMDHQFFGLMATRMNYELTTEIPHAATDYRRLMFNPGFIDNLSINELVFLIGHEICHVIWQHGLRRDGREPQKWNIAADYVINGILVNDRVGDFIEGGLLDQKIFDPMSSEQAYEYLDDNNVDTSKMSTLDTHFDATTGDSNDGSGAMRPMTDSEIKAMGDQIRNDVIQSAKSAGKVPGLIKRMVEDWLTPKVNWRDAIQVKAEALATFDRSFINPERRKLGDVYNEFVWPGSMPDESVNVIVAIDTSCSFSDEQLRASISEVKSIMNTFPCFKIHLLACDTQIYNPVTFNEETADDLGSYDIQGHGGTHLDSVFKYIENDMPDSDEYDLLIFFTDLYCGSLDQMNPDLIDTMWVISDNPNAKVPFGTKYQYD